MLATDVACVGRVQSMLATDAAPWSFRQLGLLVMPPVSLNLT